MESCVAELQRLAQLDRIVHGYAEVDVRVTRDVLEHRLGDLLAFAGALRALLRGAGQ